MYDRIRVSPDQKSLRRLPALVRRAVRLVDRAGRGPLRTAVAVQILAGIGATAQVLIARAVLHAAIVADRDHSGLSSVAPSLAALVAVTAGLALATAVVSELSTLLADQVAWEANRHILDVAAAVDLETYEEPDFHDQLERARFNANSRPVMVVNGLLGVINGLLAAAGVAVGLFVLHPLLAPFTLVTLAPLFWSEGRNGRTFYRFTVALTPSDRERTYLANTLANRERAKEIRAYDIGGFLRRRYDDLFAHRIGELRRVVRHRMLNAVAASLLASILTASTLALLFWLLLSGRMDLASTGAAALGITYLAQRLRGLASSAGTLYESTLLVEDYFTFLELDPAPPAPPAATETKGPDDTERPSFRRVEVANVSFTYPGADEPALRSVSLSLDHGEVVALVGDNGSGKTTLANVLGLLYRPEDGEVRWDGVAIDSASAAARRRAIAVIFQDFGQYWLSAADNIALGDLTRRDDRAAIAAAAAAVDADGFLGALPDGYDTVLSRLMDGGRDLSLGQWQRVALARALLRDAPLLILDEPTASLDAPSEARLFAHIREVSAGRAVLLISHRFSSVRSADRIYVLHHGQVVETGTHEELMTLGGRYAAMFTVQASAYVDPSPAGQPQGS